MERSIIMKHVKTQGIDRNREAKDAIKEEKETW
jgi:hypothetical protein